MNDYAVGFYHLAAPNDHFEFDCQQAAKFISGLKYAIQDELSLQAAHTLADAECLALSAEIQLKRPQTLNQGSIKSNTYTQPRIEPPINSNAAFQQ